DPDRRPRPAAGAQRGEGGGREVRAVDARANDLVRGRRLDHDPIGEAERAEERDDLVEAVVAPAPQIEAEVELRRRLDDHAIALASSANWSGVSASARASAARPRS